MTCWLLYHLSLISKSVVILNLEKRYKILPNWWLVFKGVSPFYLESHSSDLSINFKNYDISMKIEVEIEKQKSSLINCIWMTAGQTRITPKLLRRLINCFSFVFHQILSSYVSLLCRSPSLTIILHQ